MIKFVTFSLFFSVCSFSSKTVTSSKVLADLQF